MNRMFSVAVTFFSFCSLCLAQADLLNVSAVPQVFRPNDAQGVALGLTGVAYREGLFAGYTNPAGLHFDNYAIGFSHIPAVRKKRGVVFNRRGLIFNQEAIHLGVPLKKDFSISALVYSLYFGRIAVRYSGGGYESKKSGLGEIQLSAAKRFIFGVNEFSVGATGKYLKAVITGVNAETYLFDLGFRYKHDGSKWYSLGVSMSNIGGELKFQQDAFDRPVAVLRVGSAIGIQELSILEDIGFLTAIEYQKNISAETTEWNHLGIGTELQFFNIIFTRLGHSFDFVDLREGHKIAGFTYGLGIVTPKPIDLLTPFYLSLEYGRGLADYRELDENIITMSLGFVK